jgi:predicted neuraminidase
MLARSSCGFLCRSDSDDFGQTWSPLKPTALPNNNSGVDLAQTPDGTLLMAYNPVSKDWGPRTPLTLAMSNDDGEGWRDVATLEDAPGEYSYPAVIAFPGGFAGTYTWKRDSIAFWLGRLEG